MHASSQIKHDLSTVIWYLFIELLAFDSKGVFFIKEKLMDKNSKQRLFYVLT